MTGPSELHPSVLLARTKQRVLNSLGRRTTLTRNPDVDFISGRVDEIRRHKKQLATLSQTYRHQLSSLLQTKMEIELLYLSLWKKEVGERVYVKDIDAYTRLKTNEEESYVEEVLEIMKGSLGIGGASGKRIDGFLSRVSREGGKHGGRGVGKSSGSSVAGGIGDKGAEKERKAKGMLRAAKKSYVAARTAHSDAMLLYEKDSGKGKDDPEKDEHPELVAAKLAYEKAASKLLEAAATYEDIYRENLMLRARTHFEEERGLFRTIADSLKDVAPITDTFVTDMEEMAESTVKRTARSAGTNATHASIRLAGVKYGGKRVSDVSVGSTLTDRRTSDHLTKAFSFDSERDPIGSARSSTAAPPRPRLFSEFKEIREEGEESEPEIMPVLNGESQRPQDMMSIPIDISQNNSERKNSDRRSLVSKSSADSSSSTAFHEGRNRIELVRNPGWNEPSWGKQSYKEKDRSVEVLDDDVQSVESVIQITDPEKIVI